MSAQIVALSTPSFVPYKKMDERKRHADVDDSAAPPAKRHASAANGDEGTEIKFGPIHSPWQVDLESFQKDAIFRQMKEYKREKNVLEQQLADVEKRAKSFDDRLLTIDSWLGQLADELTLLVGDLKSDEDLTRSQSDAAYLSQLLSADNNLFRNLIDDRFARLKQIFTTIVSRIPQASPQIRELQNEISRLLSSEKENFLRAESLQAQHKDLQTKCEDFQYKWSMAKAQLAKAQSKASQYMQQQTRRRSSTDDVQPTFNEPNGPVVNGTVNGITNGAASEEAESEKHAALAEAAKRKQHVEELELENKKLSDQLTASSSRLNNLSDEDYAQTQLFKVLKSQHDDVIKKVNDLEAKNIQLREEAQKFQTERTAYRNQVEEECRIKYEEAEASIAKVDLDVQRIRSERDLIHQQKAILEGNQTKYDVAMKEVQNLNSANETHLQALSSEVKRLKIALKESEPEVNASADIVDPSEEGMRNEILKLRTDLAALNAELESMQTAVQKFRSTATKKVNDSVAMEQEIQRLKEAKHRLDSNRFNEKNVLDQRTMECENLRKQKSKSGEIIAQLKETEYKTKELCANLDKQVADFKASVELLTDQNGVLNRKVESLTNAATTHETQMKTWKEALNAKDADLTTASHAQREAEAELAKVKSKLADANKKLENNKVKSNPAGSEEIDMLRSVAFCGTCNSNLKSTLIKSCGHVLCQPCIDSRIANRQRKCPSCMKAFGTGDLMTVHLV